MINSCGSTQWLRQLAAIREIRRTHVNNKREFDEKKETDLSETNCENITAPATKCCFRHLEKQDKTNKNI